MARSEAQFTRRLLLQGGRRERCSGASTVGLGADLADLQFDAGALQRGRQRLGSSGVKRDGFYAGLERTGVVEVATGGDAFAIESHELRVECLGNAVGVTFSSGCSQSRQQIPVARRDERESLLLPVNDEAGRGALHAAGGQAGTDLAPQHRRNLVAVDAVEDAPGFLRIDEGGIEVAGVICSGEDGVFGDLVEHHALDRDLGLQYLKQVPGNGLAFTVFISCEQEFVRILECPLEFADGLLLGVAHHVVRFKSVIDVDREATERALLELRRQVFRLDQIANVTN